MLLLVDASFNTDDPGCLGSLRGVSDFSGLIDEPLEIHTINIRDAGAELDGNQFDASIILNAYEASRQKIESQRMIILIALDITGWQGSRRLSFIFGVSRTGVSSIVSTYRFTASRLTPERAALANRLTAMHELGHVWGLVPDRAAKADSRNGLYAGHYTTLCTMRQVLSVTEAVGLAAKLGADSFCADCRAYLTNSSS